MNRERYTELKNRAEECLEQRKARAAELQGAITTASTLVSTNAVRRDEAQAAGDPQAYTEAKNLADFHTEKPPFLFGKTQLNNVVIYSHSFDIYSSFPNLKHKILYN